ncbi:hypothetical protein BU25DRAFT_28448 [Macroventuria anomochaeta]|uniref:Uncharacterized protein n=1 Tax=Macroventuria anomochaeta TaxID=301207 RepID=A0ACB6S5Y3_9PLEO|nr:uncharacterized protein BU25DRAFT_28448 [Macroventuria anomochaeta]KAF2628629.1 hypothetical protein BU25DRAFT_28448 [Macroventuria anomochaeta]
MSLFSLPNELRLQIWSLAYFNEPPRLVTLRTRSHCERHTEKVFCPRFSPTPHPTVLNVCRESRAEVQFQALRADHLIYLPSPLNWNLSQFFFRLDTDILFIDIEHGISKHYDDSPDCGLLAHFLEAVGCDATSLKKIAITQIVRVAFTDGALSNCLRDFPNIEHITMVIDPKDMRTSQEKERFVLAARRIVTQYRLDMRIRAKARGEVYVHGERNLDLDFATRKGTGLELLEKSVWEVWGELERGWWKEDVPQRYIDFYF